MDKEERKCPYCGKTENQVNFGFNRSGTQRCRCQHCKKTYTLNPKSHEYSQEQRDLAIKMFYSGVSGRGVAKIFGMHKTNVYNWLKKNGNGVDKS